MCSEPHVQMMMMQPLQSYKDERHTNKNGKAHQLKHNGAHCERFGDLVILVFGLHVSSASSSGGLHMCVCEGEGEGEIQYET